MYTKGVLLTSSAYFQQSSFADLQTHDQQEKPFSFDPFQGPRVATSHFPEKSDPKATCEVKFERLSVLCTCKHKIQPVVRTLLQCDF